MKRMLFNATQREELRVAMVDGQTLYDLDIETSTKEQKKSNIYKGKITRIEPSLEAAFVDYGAERHGFLSLKEVSRSYFIKPLEGGGRPNIKDVLREGMEIIVQVDKEERGNKGAALTTFISLAGRYLVLMPNNPRAGGVSRRIEGEDRNTIREAMAQLEIPEDMGLIVRTAGVGKSTEELQWDLNYLLQLWDSIDRAGKEKPSPFLIYQESNIIIRAIRDYLRKDIAEIVIDDQATYEKAREFMTQVMPHNLSKIKFYHDEIPLFTRYQIETQIETAFQRQVSLPSGGSIVLDHTEALLSIDINSARSTRGGDIEETAFHTNLEAAEEIARQLRLRDCGGLIVIDFIDMTPVRHQREVENRLRDSLTMDRARVQVGRISRFGLLEMSRQRIRPSLGEHSQIVCPRCEGQGVIRSVESLSLNLLRIIEEDAMKENSAQVIAKLPLDAATFLLNEKRHVITGIEQRHNIQIILIPSPHLESPHYELQRVKGHEVDDNQASSYSMAKQKDLPEYITAVSETDVASNQAAVKSVAPVQPKPEAATTENSTGAGGGFLGRIFGSIFGSDTSEKQKQTIVSYRASDQKTESSNTRNTSKQGRNSSQRSRGRNDNRNRNTQNKDNQNRGNQGRHQNRGNSNKDSNRNGQSNTQTTNGAAKESNISAQEQNTEQTTQGKNQNRTNRNQSRRSGQRNRQRNRQNRNQTENTTSESALYAQTSAQSEIGPSSVSPGNATTQNAEKPSSITSATATATQTKQEQQLNKNTERHTEKTAATMVETPETNNEQKTQASAVSNKTDRLPTSAEPNTALSTTSAHAPVPVTQETREAQNQTANAPESKNEKKHSSSEAKTPEEKPAPAAPTERAANQPAQAINNSAEEQTLSETSVQSTLDTATEITEEHSPKQQSTTSEHSDNTHADKPRKPRRDNRNRRRYRGGDKNRGRSRNYRGNRNNNNDTQQTSGTQGNTGNSADNSSNTNSANKQAHKDQSDTIKNLPVTRAASVSTPESASPATPAADTPRPLASPANKETNND